MDIARRLLPALILAAAVGPGAARADPPEALATAPAAADAPPSVAEQIDAYLKTSPALALPKEGASGVTSGVAPRQLHGVVDVAVGSNGYRSAYVRGDVPVGQTGMVSIAVGESRFRGRAPGYGEGYGGRTLSADRQSLALGLSLNDPVLSPRDPRCGRPAEDASDPRFEPGRPRACEASRAAPPP